MPPLQRYKRYKKKHPTLKKGSDVFVGGPFERKQNDKAYFVTPSTVVVKEKEGILGVRSARKRSLLIVNEHFERKQNDKAPFLFRYKFRYRLKARLSSSICSCDVPVGS